MRTWPGAMVCRRARSSASRSPRLVGLSACNSSRMTVSRPARKRGASACDSSSAICSGVVSRMSGGRARWRCLREVEVSPVRVSTRIGSCICSSGVSRLRATSTASAFSGDTYSVCTLCSPFARLRPASATRLGRKPASVLPDPVGAISRVERRAAVFSSRAIWCSRGCQPRLSNQARKAGGSRGGGSTASTASLRDCRSKPCFADLPRAAIPCPIASSLPRAAHAERTSDLHDSTDHA